MRIWESGVRGGGGGGGGVHECVDIIRQQLLKQLASPRVVSFPDPPQKRKGESGNETSPRGDNDALPVQAILVLYFKS